MDKAPDAYRTISEVADDLDIAQHVLRFWETKFPQIKPLKRGGGRRYYRPDDVALVTGIRYLLYKEGYTIKGVQRILKDQGPRAVMVFGDAEPPAMPVPQPIESSLTPSRPVPPLVKPVEPQVVMQPTIVASAVVPAELQTQKVVPASRHSGFGEGAATLFDIAPHHPVTPQVSASDDLFAPREPLSQVSQPLSQVSQVRGGLSAPMPPRLAAEATPVMPLQVDIRDALPQESGVPQGGQTSRGNLLQALAELEQINAGVASLLARRQPRSA